MARMTAQLSDTEIRRVRIKHDGKQKTLHDGDGLYLLIMPDKTVTVSDGLEGTKDKTIQGSKLWRLKYRIDGKEKLTSLGKYPEVSLEQARTKKTALRSKVANGIDPIKEKEEIEAERVSVSEGTFEIIAREWHGKHAKKWKTTYALQKMQRLEKELFPYLGSRPVGEITAPELLKSLRRIEDRGNLDLAHRMHYDARTILTYAIATGKLDRNIAKDIDGALPPTQYGNRAALTEPQDVARLLKAIHVYNGHPIVIAALKLAPLFFMRPGELRSMTWSEVDLENALWSVPGEKMKMKQSHYVPLCRQAVEILTDIRPRSKNGLVFPTCRNDHNGRSISENTLNNAIRAMGFSKEQMCSHGFRAMARTMARERLKIEAEYLEIQLAHVTKAPNGTAYDRVAFIDERFVIMQRWADYLDQLRMS